LSCVVPSTLRRHLIMMKRCERVLSHGGNLWNPPDLSIQSPLQGESSPAATKTASISGYALYRTSASTNAHSLAGWTTKSFLWTYGGSSQHARTILASYFSLRSCNQISELVLASQIGNRQHYVCTIPFMRLRKSPLLRICKQIYTEALGIYYSLITVVFFDEDKLLPFLRALGPSTRKTIKQIRWSSVGSTNTADAAKRLQQLHDLIDESGLADDISQPVLGLKWVMEAGYGLMAR